MKKKGREKEGERQRQEAKGHALSLDTCVFLPNTELSPC